MKPLKFFLTGPPGIGKTTAVLRIVDVLRGRGLSVGGMVTEEVRRGGRRVGFRVIDVASGRSGYLAVANEPGEPRVGRYHVRLGEFEDVGVRALLRAIDSYEVVVCDEIGPMELYSSRFVETVEKLLSLTKPLVGTVHYRARHPLVLEIKRRFQENIYRLTLENRGRVPMLVAERIIRGLGLA